MRLHASCKYRGWQAALGIMQSLNLLPCTIHLMGYSRVNGRISPDSCGMGKSKSCFEENKAALIQRRLHLRPLSCRAHARKMPSVPPHMTTSNFAVPGRGVDTSCTNWGANPLICASICILSCTMHA